MLFWNKLQSPVFRINVSIYERYCIVRKQNNLNVFPLVSFYINLYQTTQLRWPLWYRGCKIPNIFCLVVKQKHILRYSGFHWNCKSITCQVKYNLRQNIELKPTLLQNPIIQLQPDYRYRIIMVIAPWNHEVIERTTIRADNLPD